MQSITVPSVLSPKPNILPTTATCTLVGWPSLHTRRQSHWLQVIYKTLLGNGVPYLSSLVIIAAPTRSSRYISLVTPKTNSFFGHLSFQFSAVNDWNEVQKSLKLETLISLTSFKHQLSEQFRDYCTCTQPIYNLSQTATSPPTVFIYLFILLLCTPLFLSLPYTFFHCKSTIPVFYLLYCIYFATLAFFCLLPSLSHLICSHRI